MVNTRSAGTTYDMNGTPQILLAYHGDIKYGVASHNDLSVLLKGGPSEVFWKSFVCAFPSPLTWPMDGTAQN